MSSTQGGKWRSQKNKFTKGNTEPTAYLKKLDLRPDFFDDHEGENEGGDQTKGFVVGKEPFPFVEKEMPVGGHGSVGKSPAMSVSDVVDFFSGIDDIWEKGFTTVGLVVFLLLGILVAYSNLDFDNEVVIPDNTQYSRELREIEKKLRAINDKFEMNDAWKRELKELFDQKLKDLAEKIGESNPSGEGVDSEKIKKEIMGDIESYMSGVKSSVETEVEKQIDSAIDNRLQNKMSEIQLLFDELVKVELSGLEDTYKTNLGELVEEKLEIFTADKIGMRDHAHRSSGGKIVLDLTSDASSLLEKGV
eukprot:TRINITY_DN2407_c0_g1_i1.p1 TRINITY_DN2407_c0_g1~~TRINITY_DN2407_c0_g1_i1.p1  ORF type:complete len:316 (+),score=98.05 TRINITY_DN2407_c0_g1_i1:35-949(+)